MKYIECTNRCPFCGEEAGLEPDDVSIVMDGVEYFQAHCSECQSDGPLGLSPTEAVELWDSRFLQRKWEILQERLAQPRSHEFQMQNERRDKMIRKLVRQREAGGS